MFFTKKQYNTYLNDSLHRENERRNWRFRNWYNITNKTAPLSASDVSGEPLTLKETSAELKVHYEHILKRTEGHDRIRGRGYGKWTRPWEAIPEIRNFRPAIGSGDFGIGIEVEHDFRNRLAAEAVARTIQHWRNVTLDCEGGPNGIEVTFPPMLYSKFSNKAPAMRYMALLAGPLNPYCRAHSANEMVGTHVNLSVPNNIRIDSRRMAQINLAIQYEMLPGEKERYFNRTPYGYLFGQTHGVEMKLFNSVESPETLRKYVEVAVAIMKLLVSQDPITRESAIAACEAGYAKAAKANKQVYVPYTAVRVTQRRNIYEYVQAA